MKAPRPVIFFGLIVAPGRPPDGEDTTDIAQARVS
jgi:hypothetical protein